MFTEWVSGSFQILQVAQNEPKNIRYPVAQFEPKSLAQIEPE